MLINVAGVIEVGPLDAMTLEDFHRSMDTHCWGALHTVLAVLPGMRQRGWGRIVNIASLGGKAGCAAHDSLRRKQVRAGGSFQRVEDGTDAGWHPGHHDLPGLMRTGSPRNALFKGQHQKEYAWFSIGDSLPLVSMDVQAAARKILLACQRGDAEVIVTGPGNLAVWLQTLAPNMMTEFLALVNHILPGDGRDWPECCQGF